MPDPDSDRLQVHLKVVQILEVSGIGRKTELALDRWMSVYYTSSAIRRPMDLGRLLACKTLMYLGHHE